MCSYFLHTQAHEEKASYYGKYIRIGKCNTFGAYSLVWAVHELQRLLSLAAIINVKCTLARFSGNSYASEVIEQ